MRGQNVQFGFGKGIDEKLDPKLAPPGTLVGLKNSRQQKTGRIDRRYGSTAIAALTACVRMFSRETEQCAIDGVSLLSQSPAASAWQTRDKVAEAAARRDPVKSFSTSWLDPTVAYGNGLEIWAYRGNTGALADGTVFTLVRDGTTGAIVQTETAMSVTPVATRCIGPRLYVLGTKCILLYASASSSAIYGRILDLTNVAGGWSAQTALRSDADTSLSYVYFDAVATDANNLVLAYWSTQGVRLQLYRYDATLAQQANAGVADDTLGYTAIALACDPNKTCLFVAVGKNAASGKLRFATLDPTTLATTHALADLSTPAQVESMFHIGITAASASSCIVIGTWATRDVNPSQVFIVQSNGTSTGWGSCPWVYQLSRPIAQGGNFYSVLRKGNQNTDYLVCWQQNTATSGNTFRVVAVLAPGVAHNLSVSSTHAGNHLAQVGTPSANAFIAPTSTIADSLAAGSVQLWRARFDFADRWLLNGDPFSIQRWATGQLGLSTHMSGGLLQSYDGQQVAELACLESIDSGSVTLTNAAGGSLSAGTYLYAFYWEWTDGQGQVHRSATSTPISKTVNLNDKVTITVPTLQFTNLGGVLNPTPAPYLVVCRTLVGGVSAAIFRVTMPDSIPASNLNVSTQARLTIVDTAADTTIQTNPLMYTSSGALPNTPPSAVQHLCIHRNRIYAIGDDGKTIYASTQFVNGEAVRFNGAVLLMQVEDYAIALASLDDKLVIFGERKVWIVYGDGPNELGTQGDWTTPYPLPGSVGSVDPHSVVRTHEGLYFLSRKGMRVLGRNLEFSHIKQPTDTLAANPIVTDAIALGNTENIMWACRPTPGSATGVRLVLDDYHNTWCTDLMAATGANSGTAVASFAVFQGKLYWATDAGLVFYEDPTTWLDGGNWYDSSWETAWISSQGPMGFQRIRICQVNGDRFTNHDFKLSLAVDYNAYTQSFQWTAARLSTWGRDELELRVGSQNGMNPRCRAIRMKGEILTPTNPGAFPIGTGQAAQFSGIGFEIVPLPGQKRLGKANAAT